MSRSDKIDITGCIFGDLYVVRDISKCSKKRKYECLCLKTNIKRNVIQSDLLSGKIRSIDKKSLHGMSGSPEYMVWESMIQRCQNPKDTAYKNYGAKGINVCERWQLFIFFYVDMGNRPSGKHSIDRIDNRYGYCKENCRWVTRDIQNRNHSRNVTVEIAGKKMVLTDACKEAKISYKSASYHLSKGRLFDDIVKYLKTKKRGQKWVE